MKPSGTNSPFGLPTWRGGEDSRIQLPVKGLVAIAGGKHPVPFRTRQLSPPAPMILCRTAARESRSLPALDIPYFKSDTSLINTAFFLKHSTTCDNFFSLTK